MPCTDSDVLVSAKFFFDDLSDLIITVDNYGVVAGVISLKRSEERLTQLHKCLRILSSRYQACF